MSAANEDRSDVLQASVREQLAVAGEAAVAEMIQTLQEGLKVTKIVSSDVTCRDCGKTRSYRIPVPDARAAAVVLDTWLNQSLGRPGTTETTPEQEQTVVSYQVVLGDQEREDAIHASYRSLLASASTLEEARLEAALLTNGEELR